MDLPGYAFPFLVAFFLSLVLVPLSSRVALRLGCVSVPRGDRWHTRPTPILGGVAIYLALIATLFFFARWDRGVQVVVLGSSLLFFLGLVDDLVTTNPQTKLVGQIICSAILVFFGIRFHLVEFEPINILLTFFWLIGITNAFNLLDNMDGLAGGIGLIVSLFLVLSMIDSPQWNWVVLLVSLAGTLVGFLVYNFHPASVFMGDTGSLFVGFLLASIPLVLESGSSNVVSALFGPVFIFLIPILDTTLVTLSRKISGQAISIGGKDHTSHRLVTLGLTEKRAVAVLYFLSVLSGGVALLVDYFDVALSLPAMFLVFLAISLLGVYLSRVRILSDEASSSGFWPEKITPLLVELTYRRRIFEVILDFCLIVFAYYTSYVLRFENQAWDQVLPFFIQSLPIIVLAKMVSFWFMGMYRGFWHETTVHDLRRMVSSVTVGSVLSILALLGLYRFYGYSRAAFVIDWILLLFLVCFSRVSFRVFDYFLVRFFRTGRHVLIYGAGKGGVMTLLEIQNNSSLGLRPVGFLDDDQTKHGRVVRDYPVLGGIGDLGILLQKNGIEEVIVSTDSIPTERMETLTRICGEAAVPIKKLRLAFDKIELEQPLSIGGVEK
jgi:UDP-GlcNAc:undecaprenyl-phosphate GlcNAc-1-phosphate transferase